MTEKFNYKIRNKKWNSFYSSSTKATWQRKNAVIDRLNSIKKSGRAGELEDVEVLIFPIEAAVIMSGTDFLEENREEIESKKLKKEERILREKQERTQRDIRDLEDKLERTKNQLKKLKEENEF